MFQNSSASLRRNMIKYINLKTQNITKMKGKETGKTNR